jgi:putative SOS response-associated peptidase YedK
VCSRFHLVVTRNRLERFLHLELGFELQPSSNIAPTEPILAMFADGGSRSARIMRWGMELPWTTGRAPLINIRSETAPERFKAAFAQRRCVIPATGFFEWQTRLVPGGKPIKQPYSFHRRDGELIAMAGLWEARRLPDGVVSHSCAILTCAPNEWVSRFHDRMPALLAPDDWDLWLGGEEPAARLQPLLRPFPADQMAAHPVTRALSNPRYKAPDALTRDLEQDVNPGEGGPP